MPGTLQTTAEPSIRVLLVEDNPGDARLIHELLLEARSAQFETVVAARLSDAQEALAKNEFQLILLDLSLPDSQGIDTFHRMASYAPSLPLIVLSGLDDEALALQTVKEGAQDYLVKGQVDPRGLARSIRYAMERVAAERALEEERNLLRNVIDNLLDSIYVKDSGGHYLLDNLAHRRTLSANAPEQVVGKSAFDFFPDAIASKFQEDDATVCRTGQPIVNREEVMVSNSAVVRWISTTKVPLRNRAGETVGVIGIGRDITERKAAEEQIFRYNAEIRQRNTELEDDLHMAREIQQAFLPQQFPTFPRKATISESAIRFFSRYIPTTAVGGDFFHIIPISDTEAGVFICDVMGHGVRAALVTAIQRALVEEMLPAAHDPGRFLTEINRALLSILRRARTPMFASALALVVDVGEGGCVRYANAGHPWPIHINRETGVIGPICSASERPGPALGVFKDAHYETHTRPIAARDLLILFTDGLCEVEGEHETYFNQDMLQEVLRKGLAKPADRLIDETLNEIREFAVNRTFTDDVCLIGVEIEKIHVI